MLMLVNDTITWTPSGVQTIFGRYLESKPLGLEVLVQS